jgi:hypothetical protein
MYANLNLRIPILNLLRRWSPGPRSAFLLLIVIGIALPGGRLLPDAWQNRAASRAELVIPAAFPIVSRENHQFVPRVAYASGAGEYLVVWEHEYNSSDHDIYARRVSADGSLPGQEIAIVTTISNQMSPDLAYNPAQNEYLVVWEEEYNSNDHDIRARRISASGELLGSEIAVSITILYESRPAVAYNSTRGEYLVVWENEWGSDEFRHYEIYAQRLHQEGTLIGDPTLVSSIGMQAHRPGVAYGDPDYLVVWEGWQPYSDNFGIYAQRMTGLGALAGSQIPVSTWEGDQIAPRLAYNPIQAQFLVVWQDHPYSPEYGSEIYGQRVSTSGDLVGNQIPMAAGGEKNRFNPDVVYTDVSQSFLVAWEFANEVWDRDIYARRVAYDGSRPEDAFPISNTGNSHEMRLALASGEGSALLAVWEDYRNYGSLGIDIYGEVLPLEIPRFEGYVYSGMIGEESAPLEGVMVALYCSNDQGALGVLITDTTTDGTGWYRLPALTLCEFYHIIESDPTGYLSSGSSTVGGIVVSSNWIYYTYPLEGKILTGNKFWDQNELGWNRNNIPLVLYRRAAQLIEEVRGSEMAPGWEHAVLGDLVQPIYRPDMVEPAYYEFTVMANSEPAGFIIVSTGSHDFPIPHWNFTGEAPTRFMLNGAKDNGQPPSRYYKLDTLSYVAENIAGNLVASLGEIPTKVVLTIPAPDSDPGITRTEWTPTGGGDDANPPFEGELKITGPDVQAVDLIPWESWDELKSGYSEHYQPYLEALQEDAQHDWEIESAIHEHGEILYKGDRVSLAVLVPASCVGAECMDFSIQASGAGTQLIEGELIEREGLTPIYQFTVIESTPGEEVSLEISISYTGFPAALPAQKQEIFKYIIGDLPNTMYIPLVLKSTVGLQNQGDLQVLDTYSAETTTNSWGPWHFYFAHNGYDDQRFYVQIPKHIPPNNTSCPSGCGATAWAMLFGWADYQARPGTNNIFWKPRWGIYRKDGGFGINAVAPASMDVGIYNITEEIRQHISTWCILGKAPTPPWNMKYAYKYLANRSYTLSWTKYSNWCISWNDIRYEAAKNLANLKTPVIVGTGFCAHYPLAYGYAWTSRTLSSGKIDYAHAFWVNQGWGDGDVGNGWISMSRTWFAGSIMNIFFTLPDK